MTLSDTDQKKLFRVRTTVMQMLKDRDYVVGDEEVKQTFNQFKYKYGENMKREDLVMSRFKRGDANEQVWDFRRCELKSRWEVGCTLVKIVFHRLNDTW